MTENEFNIQRQDAVDRMRQMNNRAQNGNMPPVPPFVKVPEQPIREEPIHQEENRNQADKEVKEEHKNGSILDGISSLFDGLGIPFLDKLKTDGDLTLILGLILILVSEKADKKLLFALVYILL